MKTPRVTLTLVCAALAASCSIPLSYHRFDRVVATTWSDSGPLALAQEGSFYRGAYPATPDGPGVFDRAKTRRLVLLTGETRVPIPYMPPGASSFQVTEVVARPSHRDFLLELHCFMHSRSNPWGRIWISVGFDGHVAEINGPRLGPGEVGDSSFSHDGARLLFGRGPFDDSDFRSFDLESGTIEPVVLQLERAHLVHFARNLPPWFPCAGLTNYAALSPDGSTDAFACCASPARGEACGLWLADAAGHPTLVARGDLHDERADDEPTGPFFVEPQDRHGLAWAHHRPLLYWCDHPGGQGLVIDASNPLATPRPAPCMLLASWSPDDTKIVGVVDLTVLSVYELKDEHE